MKWSKESTALIVAAVVTAMTTAVVAGRADAGTFGVKGGIATYFLDERNPAGCSVTYGLVPFSDVQNAKRLAQHLPKGFLPVFSVYYPGGHPICEAMDGEPHVKTLDGARYDLQAAGEFVGLRSESGDLEVQYRLEPYGRSDRLAVVTAVATRVQDTRITITAGDPKPLRVDGEVMALEDGTAAVGDDNESALFRTGNRYVVIWPDRTNLIVDIHHGFLNVFTSFREARRGALKGLFGDADGDPANDFRTRDGQTLSSPLDFDVLYKTFAESWRVRPGESLFDYEPGESTDTFTDRTIPTAPTTVETLPPADRERAERICREAGIVDSVLLRNCVFDFGYTSDESFVVSALSQQFSLERDTDAVAVTPRDIVLDAPDAVGAGHRFDVHWQGTDGEGDYVTIVAVSAAEGTSADFSRPREGPILELVAPLEAGGYEVRYQSDRESGVFARRPITVTPLEVSLDAPGEVAAGASFEVEWTGPDGPLDYITIVATGATAGTHLSYAYTREGSPLALKAPEEAGVYEVRYQSDRVSGVFASRQIRVR